MPNEYKNGDRVIKKSPTRYLKAYLYENVKGETHTRVEFSKKPYTSEQFFPIIMGICEAYAEQLLSTNARTAVYDAFNSAFGVFLRKLLTEKEIYERDKEHKAYKEKVDAVLDQPEDAKENDTNKMAAYLLVSEILSEDLGMDPDSINLILSKRLGTLKPIDNAEKE